MDLQGCSSGSYTSYITTIILPTPFHLPPTQDAARALWTSKAALLAATQKEDQDAHAEQQLLQQRLVLLQEQRDSRVARLHALAAEFDAAKEEAVRALQAEIDQLKAEGGGQ